MIPLLESYPKNEYFDSDLCTCQCYFTLEITQVMSNRGMIELRHGGVLCNH